MAMNLMENSFTMNVLLSKTFIPHGKWIKTWQEGSVVRGGSSALVQSGVEEMSLSTHNASEALCSPGETPVTAD